ncbi:hypothetical protein TARUN_9101 [Trichoderma arundinaceum]|uniref:Uncharacterized protein n=1 Tax=Trichoderma arundinaceum TaxID=490622 RepID=A0A395NAN0_TRIAR|nr:hypothetical protein TARUN_9101 [Trichoderma arundinaceum]
MPGAKRRRRRVLGLTLTSAELVEESKQGVVRAGGQSGGHACDGSQPTTKEQDWGRCEPGAGFSSAQRGGPIVGWSRSVGVERRWLVVILSAELLLGQRGQRGAEAMAKERTEQETEERTAASSGHLESADASKAMNGQDTFLILQRLSSPDLGVLYCQSSQAGGQGLARCCGSLGTVPCSSSGQDAHCHWPIGSAERQVSNTAPASA